MMEYREGGLKDQGGSVDPVSGNEVPPGALKEEVRDDIDARLSEGEFVFPADVVRYIGLEKLMMMRQQAKVGLSRMEDMGQMSNADEAVMEDTVPASVFDMPDDMDVPAVMVAELEMAEGGDVQGDKRYKSFRELMGTDGDTAEVVTYINAAGRKIIIMHINGAPVSQVPEGFYPEGTDSPDTTAPTTPETAPQVAPQAAPQVQEDDPDPQSQPRATITTGGYIADGRVIGGTQWEISYEFDGSVNLKNAEYGEVQLTKDEAAGLDLKGGLAGLANVFSAFTPDGIKSGKERTATLNSGSAGDPGAGNAIHKAIVERAELQKVGREFVEGRSPELGFKDSIKTIFGDGPRNELEGAIAQALGKTSNEFTDADFAIVGLALKGGAQVHDLGSGGPDYSKVTAVQTLLKGIDSNLIRSGLERPDAIGQGMSAPDPIPDGPDGPDGPGFGTSIFGTEMPPTGPGGDEPAPTVPQGTAPPTYAPFSGLALTQGFPGADYDPRRYDSPGGVDYGTVSQFEPEPTRPTPLVRPSLPTPRPTPTRPAPLDNREPPAPTRPAPLDFISSYDNRPRPQPAPTRPAPLDFMSSYDNRPRPQEDRTNFAPSRTYFSGGGLGKRKRKGLASR